MGCLSIHRLLLKMMFTLSVVLLASCGGGGGSSDSKSKSEGNSTSSSSSKTDKTAPTSPPANAISLKGMGVKGPLANATVTLYQLDPSHTNLHGDVIASGYTDAAAALQLTVDDELLGDNDFIIEYSNGRELNGSTPVVKTLKAVITAEQIRQNISVYATPLTSWVIDYATHTADMQASSAPQLANVIGNADATLSTDEFRAALGNAQVYAIQTFGLGALPENTDLFTTAPVLSDNTDQSLALAYRSSIEVLSSIAESIRENIAPSDAKIETTDILKALAEDLSDGKINGKDGTVAIEKLKPITESTLKNIVTVDPETVRVPGTNVTVSKLKDVLATEAKTVAPDVTVGKIQSPTLAVVVVDHVAANTSSPPKTSTGGALTATFSNLSSSYKINSGANVTVSLSGNTNAVRDVVFQVWSSSKGVEAAYLDNSAPYIYPSSVLNTVAPGENRHIQALIRGSNGTLVKLDTVVAVVSGSSNSSTAGGGSSSGSSGGSTGSAGSKPSSYSVVASWSVPTKRTDGSTLATADIGGYELYYYEENTPSGQGMVVNLPASENGQLNKQHTITVAQPGNYVIAIAAYDSQGNYSDISPAVIASIQ